MDRECEFYFFHATYLWLNLFFKVMDVLLKPRFSETPELARR